MRLVRVTVPQGKGEEVARLALDAGVPQASVQPLDSYSREGRESKEVVDVNTSTPTAKKFIDALLAAPFYDPADYSIFVREPRAIITKEGPRRLTRPVVIPETDLYEELWQFSRVTASFVARFLAGAVLLSYGMLKFNLLLMIAGLLFLPLLPTLLAMSFGLLTREFRLAAQGLFALTAGAAIIVAGGALVAWLAGPPLRFQEFSSLEVAAVLSAAVGVAAGFATTDDVGRREMLGLAATAQTALIPAWLGISLVIGFSQGVDPTPPARRLLTFAVIVAVIIISSLVTYAAVGVRGTGLRRFSRCDAE
jgi:drug/metabolite transporter (DMT)-like permease